MKRFSKKFLRLIDVMEMTHEFREVIRSARPPYHERNENDTEHSYQLAMVAWFLIEQDHLKLDREKCLMYALAHDLVEIYAGDTFIFDKQGLESKKKREEKAFVKLKKRFKHFKSLIRVLNEYHKRNDDESRFIYALDKVLTPIQIYLEDGKMWHEKGVSLEELSEYKNHKIIISPAVDVYWRELLEELQNKRKKLFPKK